MQTLLFSLLVAAGLAKASEVNPSGANIVVVRTLYAQWTHMAHRNRTWEHNRSPPIFPHLVRIAFHSCYGGCNGHVNHSSPFNAGLKPHMDRIDALYEVYTKTWNFMTGSTFRGSGYWDERSWKEIVTEELCLTAGVDKEKIQKQMRYIFSDIERNAIAGTFTDGTISRADFYNIFFIEAFNSMLRQEHRPDCEGLSLFYHEKGYYGGTELDCYEKFFMPHRKLHRIPYTFGRVDNEVVPDIKEHELPRADSMWEETKASMGLGFPGVDQRDIVLLLSAHAVGGVNKAVTGFGLDYGDPSTTTGHEEGHWNAAHGHLFIPIYLKRLNLRQHAHWNAERNTTVFVGHDDPVDYGCHTDSCVHLSGELCGTPQGGDVFHPNTGQEYCYRRVYMQLPVDMSMRREMNRLPNGQIQAKDKITGEWVTMEAYNDDHVANKFKSNPDTDAIFDDYILCEEEGVNCAAVKSDIAEIRWVNHFTQRFEKMITTGYQGDFSGSTDLPALQIYDISEFDTFCHSVYRGHYGSLDLGSLSTYCRNYNYMKRTCDAKLLGNILANFEEYGPAALGLCLGNWSQDAQY